MSRLVSVVQSPPFGHVAQGSGQTVEMHDVSGVGVDAFGETRSGSDPPSEGTDRAQDAWSVSVIADVARTRAARRRGFIGDAGPFARRAPTPAPRTRPWSATFAARPLGS
jgi:hypothetical protein